MALEVILNIWEKSKVWTSRKSNVNKSKNDECRCIKPICLESGLVLENMVV